MNPIQRIGIAFDQFWNAVAGLVPALRRLGFGDEDETVSSVFGKAALRGERWALVGCRFLNWLFRSQHCIDAIEKDREPQAGGRTARWPIEMVMAVYASQRSGGRVRLPLEKREHPLLT